MIPNALKTLAALAALAALAGGSAAAQTPVTTGVVLRGITLPGPAGAPGTAVNNPGRTCPFTDEDTTNGRLDGVSVQCRANGNLANTIPGMPVRFNAYCMAQASRLRGRLITSALDGNPNHCALSATTPANATADFGGAIWR